MFCVFVGSFLVLTGIYEEKIKQAESVKKIEYKFIPRTYYEEQMAESDLLLKVGDMFNSVSPWYDRTIGALADIPDFKRVDTNTSKHS